MSKSNNIIATWTALLTLGAVAVVAIAAGGSIAVALAEAAIVVQRVEEIGGASAP